MDINQNIEQTTHEALMLVEEMKTIINKVLHHQLARIDAVKLDDYSESKARELLWANLKVHRARVTAKINEQ